MTVGGVVSITPVEFRVGAALLSGGVALVGWLIWRLFDAKLDSVKGTQKTQGEDIVEMALGFEKGLAMIEKEGREYHDKDMRQYVRRIEDLERNDSKTTASLAELQLKVNTVNSKCDNQKEMLEDIKSAILQQQRQMSDLMALLGGRRGSDGR